MTITILEDEVVAYNNQIEQLQALVLILLGDADHQAQVGGHHAITGPLGHAQLALVLGGVLPCRQLQQAFASLHVVVQLNFFGGREQGHPSNGA